MSTLEFVILCGFPCLVFPAWCLWHLHREGKGESPTHNESWLEGDPADGDD